MKRFYPFAFPLLPFFLFLALPSAAQNFKDQMLEKMYRDPTMVSAKLIDRAEDMLAFSEKYPKKWLPIYYASYYYYLASRYTLMAEEKKQTIEKAYNLAIVGLIPYPKYSRNLLPATDYSELLALKALIMIEEEKEPERIWKVIEKAKEEKKKNPRSYLAAAILHWQQKEEDAALKEVEIALRYYDKKTKELYPFWGQGLAEALYSKLQ